MALNTLKLPQKLWGLTKDVAVTVDREYLQGFLEDMGDDDIAVVCQHCCHTQVLCSSGCCSYCGSYLGVTDGEY